MAKIDIIRARVEPRKKREMAMLAKEEGAKSLSEYMLNCVEYRKVSLPYLKELDSMATKLAGIVAKMKKM